MDKTEEEKLQVWYVDLVLDQIEDGKSRDEAIKIVTDGLQVLAKMIVEDAKDGR